MVCQLRLKAGNNRILFSFVQKQFFVRRCSVKKVFRKIHMKRPAAESLFLTKIQVKASNFTKRETLAPLLSCEFRETFKNIYIVEHLLTSAFVSPLNFCSS